MEASERTTLNSMAAQMRTHLYDHLVPFWKDLRDDEHGGYIGLVTYDLARDERAEKGCILNSRILWFFSSAYLLSKELGAADESLLDEARHAYEFLRDACLDRTCGGLYWSLTFDGKVLDGTKHTYNQAFGIYALSAYYEASGDAEALEVARSLRQVIETKCRDEGGYLEAFTVDFQPASNEKLSENGVMAGRTMNTLLHVLEAYTLLEHVSPGETAQDLVWILRCFAEKMYNPELRRMEVFFDMDYHTLIDLYSCGHDIETSWLIDRCLEVLGDAVPGDLRATIARITSEMAQQVLASAFDGHSLPAECERGVMKEDRVWWVQAETVVGFVNAWLKDTAHAEFPEAAASEWTFIQEHVIDPRDGSEWFSEVAKDGTPTAGLDIVQPWKCPYHNGRMCMEVIRRAAAL